MTLSGQGAGVALSCLPSGLSSTTRWLSRSHTWTLPLGPTAMPAAAVFLSQALGIQYFVSGQSGSSRSKKGSGLAPGAARSCR